MYQLKKMLDDLVDYAYKDDAKLRAYHAFYIEVSDADRKSKHGHYEFQNRKIVLFNTYRNETKLVITSIHELAHHVTHMQGNFKVHGREFYANFELLLHGALDMNLFSKQEWMDMISEIGRDAIDENKISRMLDKYEPKSSGYKADKRKIVVYDSYSIKEELKEKGFSFNKISKAWEIETDLATAEELKVFLDGKEAKYNVVDAARVLVKNEEANKPSYLVSVTNSYNIRERLKKMFEGHTVYFRGSDKSWCIKCESVMDVNMVLRQIKELCDKNPQLGRKFAKTKRVTHSEVQVILT